MLFYERRNHQVPAISLPRTIQDIGRYSRVRMHRSDNFGWVLSNKKP